MIEGKGVRTFVLPAEDLESSGLRYFLSGTDGRIPLPETVTVRPTQLVNLTRVVRSSFHAGDRSGRSGETWPEYSEVDEGVEIELRALVRADGEFDLRTGVRVARVLSRSPEDSAGSSPEGPVQTISVARARARLAAGQGLLISGLPAPTPVVGRRDRMVVLVTAAGSKPR